MQTIELELPKGDMLTIEDIGRAKARAKKRQEGYGVTKFVAYITETQFRQLVDETKKCCTMPSIVPFALSPQDSSDGYLGQCYGVYLYDKDFPPPTRFSRKDIAIIRVMAAFDDYVVEFNDGYRLNLSLIRPDPRYVPNYVVEMALKHRNSLQ